jgi:C-methyltransferase
MADSTVDGNSGSATVDAVRRVEQLAVGAGVAAIVQAAVRLELPDAFDDGTVTAEELAKSAGADPGTLGRLMRALVCHDVFAEVEPGRYAHTELSRWLRADAPVALRYLVLWLGAPWTWQAWPHLAEAVTTGEAVVPALFGKPFYAYLREDAPESAQWFNLSMTALTALNARAIVDAFDLSGVRSVADVAGGQGRLLKTLLERHPDVTGVLLDLESVVAEADPALLPGGALAHRSRVIGGDCLEEVPVDVDLYVLKNILDWPDDNSDRTLRNIRRAARPGARVLVVDSLMDAPVEELRVTSLIDLFLLLNVGGQRHTRQDFERLFERSGLDLVGAVPVPGTFPTQHFVEALVPAAPA